MINWKIRLKQKTFLVASFSAILLAAQSVAKLFGYEITDEFGVQLTYTFNSILSVLVVLGIVVDPTTSGVFDSTDAQNYSEPK